MAQPRREPAFALMAFIGLVRLFLAHAALAEGDVWTPRTPMQTPQRLLAAAAYGGKVYTFGGCGSPCFEPPIHTSTDEETRVQVYDPAKDIPGGHNSWEEKQRMSAILFGAAAAAPGNGRIYTFGGFVTPNLTQEYDPASDSWRKRKAMPTPRHGLAAVAFGHKVYVLGGSDGRGPSDALEIYDPASDTWTRGPRMPTARVFLAAAELNGKIYAVGGSPDCCGKSQTAAVEIYDPDPNVNRWTAGASLPVALQTSAAASVNGKIYVFGGFIPGAGVQKTTFEYDPTKDPAVNPAADPTGNPWSAKAKMLTARDQAPAVALNGFVYVLGGAVECHCSALGQNEEYTPETPPLISLICTKTGPTSVVAGDSVTYMVTVTNTGKTAAIGVILHDPTPEGVNFHRSPGGLCGEGFPCSLGTIEAGGSRGPVEVTFEVPEECSGPPGSITNVARVRVQGVVAAVCKAKPTLVLGASQERDLAISIMGPTSPIGQAAEATYSVVVTHTGAPMTGVRVKVEVTGGTPLPPAPNVPCALSSPGAIHPEGFICNLDPLPEGASPPPLELKVRTGEGCPCPPSIAIKATVTANEKECNTNNNAATATTGVRCEADLAIEKTIDKPNPSSVDMGEAIPYHLKVHNGGPDRACEVEIRDKRNPDVGRPILRDPIPLGLACSVTPENEVICSSDKVDSGADIEMRFDLPQTAPCGTKISNTATVAAASTKDPDTKNNSDTAGTTVACCDLAISKTDGLTEAMPGDSLTYEITVKNLAKVDAEATVADPFPEELTGVRWCRDAGAPCEPGTPGDLHEVLDLAAGATATYRAQGTVDAMFIGTLANTATVTAPPDCKSMAMDTTEITCTGVKAFCKDVSGSFLEGSVVTYTFVLLNCGPAVQMDNPGDEFSDPQPAGLTFVSAVASSGTATLGNPVTWNGLIPVGDMVTITIDATINAGTAGTTICNQAMIAFDADGDGVNESNALSDDPNEPGPADPCCFRVRFPFQIPALSLPGLLALVLLLAAFAVLRLRRRSP
jgi:uncharacterized repeat protein (TIGR01451 family)